MDRQTGSGQSELSGEAAAASATDSLRAFAKVGLGLLLLVFFEGQLLPRIEGSAEPTLVAIGPWSILPARIVLGGEDSPTIFLAILALAGLSGLYALGLAVRTTGHWRELLVVLALTGLLCSVVVLSPPARGADLFYYAFQGRMIARGGLNPYVDPPRVVEADSWFPFVSPFWRDNSTGYGPTWLLLSAELDRAFDGGGTTTDFVQTVVAYRALLAGLTLANGLLIWLILAILAPARRLAGVVAYAWNPAVLVVGTEHNDTLMLFLALLGVWLHLKGRPTLAVVALTLSFLVKYYTGPLLLGYLIWQWRASPEHRVYRFVALPAGLTLLAFLPFNPLAVAMHVPSYLATSGRLEHVERVPLGLLVALAVLVAVRLVRLPEIRGIEPILGISLLVLSGYLAFLSRDRFPWYVVTALGLSALLGGRWLEAAGAAGATWLLGLHQGTAYLVGLLQQAFGLASDLGLEVVLLGPSLALGLAGALWQVARWPRRSLLVGGLAVLGALTVAVEAPLLRNLSGPPPVVDLGAGRSPGPIVLGTALEWEDWSWGVTVEQIGTPTGPDGSRSLCLVYSDGYGSLYAHHPGFATSGYQALELDLGPDAAGRPPLALALRGPGDRLLGSVPLASYLDAVPSVGGWRRVRVPLAALGASDATVTGVLVQYQGSSVGGSRSTCLQRVVFVPNGR